MTTGARPDRERGPRRRLPGTSGVSLRRVSTSLPAILQITAAAVIAYLFAREVLGHDVPLLAVTVSLSSLGFVRDARPVRVLETAVGMTLGIAVAEAVVLTFGQGIVQLAVVLSATLVIARLLSPAAAFAIAAAIQSVLVSLLPAPDGGPFVRVVDGVVGGVVALAATALIPRDPRRAAIREARALFAEFEAVTASLVSSLRYADHEESERALVRVRGTQPLLDAWRGSLDSARAIVSVSPIVRRHRAELERQAVVLDGMDLATRNLRVIARRLDFVGRDGQSRPAVADLLARVSAAVSLLSASLDDIEQLPIARRALEELARHLRPEEVLGGDARVSEQALVIALRPLVVDLLVAAGMPVGEAQALLPPT
ncbi:FUSC family protein [Labedella gwakjiensis]|uniref:FUSC family protein n=1 Tax=Labedella gwakjiensis TaxID=390269 RepID=A0ABY0C5Z6_9MICO|nr:FUSC family protein [Labedella gwakjiensis]RUQ85492.1 FUSC family protein [Labedella gwakjiensis]